METCNVLVIGAGPGGLAAAKSACDHGAGKVVVIERDDHLGGILQQCIHDGFGLIRYGAQLSGPEYAARACQEATNAGAEIRLGCQAVHISDNRVVTTVSREGMLQIHADTIVLSTGCRERTRGAIAIPGTRPAGVFTAGVVQNLVNMHNIMVGKAVVILGSGDIGLIMARRLSLEGATVKAVIEVMPSPCGLARNISQCLYDFDIPIYVSHTVSRIVGDHRLEGVEISEVDEHMQVVAGTTQYMPCDTLVLSVGLIPENELAEAVGVRVDPKTNCVLTDDYLQTSVAGIFSCGNSRRIMDLADFVSEQGELAGENAVHHLRGEPMHRWDSTRGTAMKKGFPEENSITCTLCPNGCQVIWNEEEQEFSGNRCPRGAKFAAAERETPVRTLTTTMRVYGGCKPLISVRTRTAVKKTDIFPLIEKLRSISVKAPVSIGDTLYENGDICVIATESLPQSQRS